MAAKIFEPWMQKTYSDPGRCTGEVRILFNTLV